MADSLSQARWTHVALPTGDLEKSISFYTALTPLVVVRRFQDADGTSAWLSNPGQYDSPFVLVLVSFNRDKGKQLGLLAPFAHLGIEVPSRAEVDRTAQQAEELGCLHWPSQYVNEQVGYVCALKDPDGNVVEISYNQKVYDTIREVWGQGED